jgi:hypothetical protein
MQDEKKNVKSQYVEIRFKLQNKLILPLFMIEDIKFIEDQIQLKDFVYVDLPNVDVNEFCEVLKDIKNNECYVLNSEYKYKTLVDYLGVNYPMVQEDKKIIKRIFEAADAKVKEKVKEKPKLDQVLELNIRLGSDFDINVIAKYYELDLEYLSNRLYTEFDPLIKFTRTVENLQGKNITYNLIYYGIYKPEKSYDINVICLIEGI